MVSEIDQIRSLFEQLFLFRNLNENPVIRGLFQRQPSVSLYGWYGVLLERYPHAANPWARFLWDTIKTTENYLALQAERNSGVKFSPALEKAALADLKNLTELIRWQPDKLVGLATDSVAETPDSGFLALANGELDTCLQWLTQWYSQHGVGLFSGATFFCWDTSAKKLLPVAAPDPITLEQLIGYESQKQELLDNTTQLLNGLPSNNILLYGDRGTGKSSLVKAMGNQFADRGLRLIEMSKNDLADFPQLLQCLLGRGLKFIIFVDDLSFEPAESQYKHLKAILEGGLASRPQHIVIYATSNRRHLIRETMAERNDDVHFNDAMQEKLSLADRFGLTITFTSPDQSDYLNIVKGIATQRGLAIDDAELSRRAVQWERFQNGRSGRTAKQFVDHLQGQLGLTKPN